MSVDVEDLPRTVCGHIVAEAVLALAREIPGDGRATIVMKAGCPICGYGGWGYSYGRLRQGEPLSDLVELGDPVPGRPRWWKPLWFVRCARVRRRLGYWPRVAGSWPSA